MVLNVFAYVFFGMGTTALVLGIAGFLMCLVQLKWGSDDDNMMKSDTGVLIECSAGVLMLVLPAFVLSYVSHALSTLL